MISPGPPGGVPREYVGVPDYGMRHARRGCSEWVYAVFFLTMGDEAFAVAVRYELMSSACVRR